MNTTENNLLDKRTKELVTCSEWIKDRFKRDQDYERFWSKVTLKANPFECWEWTAGKGKEGYGIFGVYIASNKWVSTIAHRIAFACFGRYFYQTNRWSIEGRLGFDQKKVKYFMYIDNPYILNF